MWRNIFTLTTLLLLQTTKCKSLISIGPIRSPRCHKNVPSNVSRRQVFLDDEEWQAGDVYEDIRKLEQGIMLADAEQDLMHQQRLETLDYMASRRRLILPDLRKAVIAPISASIGLLAVLKVSLEKGKGQMLYKFLNALSSFHVWSSVVLPPLLFLFAYRANRRGSQVESSPDLLSRLDPEYRRFVTTWEDPAKSTKNHVLCLLEQWSSAVAGFLIFAPWLPQMASTPTRTVVRLGAWASLRQFQQLWFELIREKQPRPLTQWVWALQSLVRLQATQWFIATDLALCLCRVKLPLSVWGIAVSSLYAVFGLLIKNPSCVKRVTKVAASMQRLALPGMLSLWVFSHIEQMKVVVLWLQKFSLSMLITSPRKMGALFPYIFNGMAVFGSTFLALCHILAFQNLFEFVHMHNVSLASENFQAAASDEKLYGWRYKLKWREARRVRVLFSESKRKFFYWLLYSGRVEDKLTKGIIEERRKQASNQRQIIWHRLSREEPRQSFVDRSTWKQRAMDYLAKRHERDYENKTFQDPLGIAVYKALGIGLGFQFDHMAKPSAKNLPVTQRLQARAAKSAIRRVQEIYSGAKAAKEELDQIEDPVEKDKRAMEMRFESEKEIQFLASRLSELIPTDTSGSTPDIEFQTFEKISDNEFVVQSSGLSTSDTVKSLLGQKDSALTNETDSEMEERFDGDGEFLTAWEKQNVGRFESNEPDDDTRTLLA